MSYTNLNFHVVFSTKEHRAFLNEEQMGRLIEYMDGIVRNLKATLLLAGGTPDHVHIAVRLHPELAIAEFVRKLKTNTSKWVREQMSEVFTWQEGYSAFSVSQSVIGKVIEYIQGQKEHHQKLTFQEELEMMLKKHNVDYDARYL
jgi:REP element-mobilizing transposase RayT